MLATAAITNPIIRSKKDGKAKKALKAHKSKKAQTAAINLNLLDAVAPTMERAVMGDVTEIDARNRSHVKGEMNPRYRVIDVLERLFSRGHLDHSGGMNEAMYLSALWLRETHRRGGLDTSLGGGELDRIVSSGGNFSDKLDSHAGAVDARREFAHAVKCMGWYGEDGKPGYYPFRGCGRIVVGLVCYGHSIRECAGLYLGGASGRTEVVAMDRLREGLMTLAGVRGLTARRTSLQAAVQGFRDFAPGDVSW